MGGMSTHTVPQPKRPDPPVSARVPSNIQRQARARAATLGETYGEYLTRLITEDTADNIAPLMRNADSEPEAS